LLRFLPGDDGRKRTDLLCAPSEPYVTQKALQLGRQRGPVADDLPDAPVPLVDEKREREQVARDAVELSPGRDDEVDQKRGDVDREADVVLPTGQSQRLRGAKLRAFAGL